MPKIDPAAFAVNAAGIADAFRVLQIADQNGEARIEELTRVHEGWCGVVLRIAEAGEIMERFRAKHGTSATWGGDLPYLYDVWDAVAQALWANLGATQLGALVEEAIEQVASVEAA
jgi:hypothetical protein